MHDVSTLAEERAEAGPGQLRALEQAFEHFTSRTAQLEEAYEALKERADRLNLELERANRELERKVRELDAAYNFQRSILESIPTAVVVTELDGTVRALNRAAERTWGVSRDQALGRHVRQVTGPHGSLIEAVLEGRSRQESELRELAGPEPRIIHSSACLVEDSQGRPIGAVQLDRDVTRLSSLQRQLYEQGKLADLGKMAAGLAHEIRKPLNGIRGFASILERELDEEHAHHRYVHNIVGAADRLNSLLGRLLDFARPDGMRLASCDLRAEGRQVEEFVRAAGLPDAVRLSVGVPEDARWVTADPDKIKQVLLNLVQNAVEALEGAGTVAVGTELGDHDGDGAVCVTVRDTGRGMTAEEQARIFEPFYTSKPGGTGLGLCIVRRILELHGSPLRVESRPGEGTAMSFMLPRASGVERP